MASPQSILSRPLSVYSLPPALLDTLAVRSIQDAPAGDGGAEKTAPNTHDTLPLAPAGTVRCQTCPGAAFETVEEQRQHFKSDWHRYNAKAKLTGRAVTAEEWDGMVEGISSISGSASSSSSTGSSQSQQPQSKLSRLLARQTMNDGSKEDNVDSDEEAEIADRKRRAQLRTAIVWFSPSKPLNGLGVPKDTQLGVHRALFPRYDTAADYLRALRDMQLDNSENDEERRITLLMVAGGHFAGMVVGLRPKGHGEKQLVKGAGDVRVIHHKTFHRYTTRRKQGGSQGLNDNAKSKANSAGAMLRRYGEQALQDDIRALMTEWAEDIGLSERIFIRASTHGKKSFWGYDEAVLDKGDERIRTFPFPTRRPTLQELLRCWHELTRVKVSHLSEEALAALDEEYIASLQPKTKPVKPMPAPIIAPVSSTPKLSPEEEAKIARSKRIDEMVRKGRVEALKPMFEKYPAEFDASLLGVAASAGQEDMVRYLILDARVDPTSSLENGRKAYELASTKGVRNIFRRIAYDNPDLCDWAAARVPSGLSEEAEAAQNQKKADRRKGMREKLKERAATRAVEEEKEEEDVEVPPVSVFQAPSIGPQRLGGAASVAGLSGMSVDMRQRIERERRARAAEARLKATPS